MGVSVLLYGCTIWMLTKNPEKMLAEKYTKMLRAALNKSWKEYPKKTATVWPLTSHLTKHPRKMS